MQLYIHYVMCFLMITILRCQESIIHYYYKVNAIGYIMWKEKATKIPQNLYVTK